MDVSSVSVTQGVEAPLKVTAFRPICLYPFYPRYNGQGDSRAGGELHLREPMTAGTPGVHEEYPG